jgi:hypothetical protein
MSRFRPYSRCIGKYRVALHGETGIRVDVVEAGSPEEAALRVSSRNEDIAGSAYVVRRDDGSEPPVKVTIGSI